MATAVLRSHDCLKNRIHVDFFGSRPPPPPMRSSRRKNSRSPPSSPPVRTRPAPRRPAGSPPPLPEARPSRKPDKENAPTGSSSLARPRSKALVMGEVTILKRGEEPKPFLPSSKVKVDAVLCSTNPLGPKPFLPSSKVDAVLCSTNPLGPDPGAVPKFSALGCSTYAGPAFISSPAPSALPFPESFLKKEDLATKGLRCLLRLDGR